MTATAPVVLASGSATRARLLAQAGVPCVIEPPQVDEAEIKRTLQAARASAADTADALAETKALRVSRRYPEVLVIGADQMLDCAGRWFDKPGDRTAARAQLLDLGGKTHELHSAVVVALGGRPVWRHREAARLTMRPLSPAFVDWYLDEAGEDVQNSVGAYHIEGLGAQLFLKIDGDHFTVQGLPLLPLLDYLRRQRVIPT